MEQSDWSTILSTVTPNFNWPVPTSGDLVKNGATAIEALGDGIDASFVDLKGGTTGQVLSKASNTDLDYSWVTTDDANAIQNSIVDAKGDIVAATANDTPARLPVGTNGQELLADSTATTGLRWTSTPAASNPVINSAYNVWQRGTSISIAASTVVQYSADRWYTQTGASQAVTVSRQGTGDTTNLPFVQYCARVQRNSGQTGTADFGIFQSFETVNSIPFAGKTVTMSFYARSGANFSATSSVLRARLYSGTGTDQNLLTSYTGLQITIDASATLTSTWQRFTFTGTVSSTATELTVGMYYAPTGTAGAADFFEVTGVQIDIGNVALPFRTTGVTYEQELAACKRYFQVFGNSVLADRALTTGVCYANNQVFAALVFDEMRVSPTANIISGTIYDVVIGGTVVQTNLNAIVLANFTPRTAQIEVGSTATPFTVGHAALIRLDNGIIIQLGAEL
jgi:hypothetical protein